MLAGTVAPFTLPAQSLVSERPLPNSFLLGNATICVDAADFTAVQIAASLLQQDLEAVTGKEPELKNTITGLPKTVIIIGTADRSSFISELIQQKKISITAIKGKWEAYQLQVVSNPFKGVEHAIVITGSDRRGTAFGVFELSKQIGVSPWYWWADVPVKKKSIYILRREWFSGMLQK